MKIMLPIKRFSASNAGRATSLSVVTLLGVAVTSVIYLHSTRAHEASGTAPISEADLADVNTSPDRQEIVPVGEEGWFFTSNVKYLSTTATVDNDIDIDIDPWTIGLGFGYSF